jgi:hypothetical protein
MEQTNKGDVFLQAFFDLLAKDYIEDAVKNLRKAVKEGNLRAMYWLGKLYRNGWLGCQRSPKRASEMWNASLDYGPSTVMLRRDRMILSRVELKLDDALARAVYWTGTRQMSTQADIDQCCGVFLEYYHLAACNTYLEDIKIVYLNEGAQKGCTACLIDLYKYGQLRTWQHRRRLWRHCPRALQFDDMSITMHLLGSARVDEFGCYENVRHIVCLLMWARKTQNSPVLVTLPRDVLRLICERLLRTSWEETQDEALVWNHMPKKKRRKTTK